MPGEITNIKMSNPDYFKKPKPVIKPPKTYKQMLKEAAKRDPKHFKEYLKD